MMPRPFKIAKYVVVACFVFATLVLIYPYVVRSSSASLSSMLNFSSLLATVVGGMMAVAGLIVALVSVVSFATLEQRMEDKFNELVRQTEQQQRSKTNAMFQGFALQLQSVNSEDLYRAESLLEEALKLYPDLQGSRRQLALRFYTAVEEAYMAKLLPPPLGKDLPWRYVQGNTYSYEAEKWLERAREYGEDEDKFVSLCLAKLYGMRGRFDRMLQCLKQAGDRLQQATKEEVFRLICTCSSACETEQQLLELSKVLNRPLPLSWESVSMEVNSLRVDWSHPFVAFIGRRKPVSLHVFETPAVFQFRIHPTGDAKYQVTVIGDSPNDIQRFPYRETGAPDSISWDEAWKLIDSLCWVLARADIV